MDITSECLSDFEMWLNDLKVVILSHCFRYDSVTGNIGGLIALSNQMDAYSNQMVEYLWIFNLQVIGVMTSNVHGYYFNPSLYFSNIVAEPEDFASLY